MGQNQAETREIPLGYKEWREGTANHPSLNAQHIEICKDSGLWLGFKGLIWYLGGNDPCWSLWCKSHLISSGTWLGVIYLLLFYAEDATCCPAPILCPVRVSTKAAQGKVLRMPPADSHDLSGPRAITGPLVGKGIEYTLGLGPGKPTPRANEEKAVSHRKDQHWLQMELGDLSWTWL